MSDDDEKDAVRKASGEGAAHLVDGGIGLAAGVLAAPVLGPLAPAVGLAAAGTSKVLRSLVRSHVQARTDARFAAYEAELARELEAGGAVPEELAKDERFAEAVFQGYRRVMEAIDPAAVEPLARLTARHGRDADAFFRRAGRFLHDASREDLDVVRAVVAAVRRPAAGRSEQVHVGWTLDGNRPVPYVDDRGGAGTFGFSGDDFLAEREAYRSLDIHGLAVCSEGHGILPTLTIRIRIAHDLAVVLGPASK